MEQLMLKAYGKINLGLDALAKRPDGYHELAMIMQTVDIYDELHFTVTDGPGIRLTVEFPADSEPVKSGAGSQAEPEESGAGSQAEPEESGAGSQAEPVGAGVGSQATEPVQPGIVPADPSNLVWRAADLLMREFRIEKGVDIRLVKRIPVAAGMAGGSSDCAAALKGINRLFRLGLSLSELQARGVKLGADVPYCLLGGTALATGIGEILTVLPDMPDCPMVVAKPGIGISTPFVFRHLRVYELESHPDIAGMRRAIEEGNLGGIVDRLGNVLETAAIPHYPIVGELKEAMAGLGAGGVLMSGSGPTVFGIFPNEELAGNAAKKLKEKGLAAQVFVTRPCTPESDMEVLHGE